MLPLILVRALGEGHRAGVLGLQCFESNSFAAAGTSLATKPYPPNPVAETLSKSPKP